MSIILTRIWQMYWS